MSSDPNMRRTLHFKFTMPGAQPAQLSSMIKATAPFYQMFGNMRTRLLQNVDDPAKFTQEIEYDAPEAVELNRQKIASDPRVQAYLQGWRAMFPGAIEVEIYREID